MPENTPEPISAAATIESSRDLPQASTTILGRNLGAVGKTQLSRNMSAGSLMALVGTILSVISYPLYLHYLGYHNYGLWLVLSVVVSVAQLGNLGVPWALMKLVAEDYSHRDWEGVKTYINIGCGVIFAAGLVFVLVITLIRQSILQWFKLSGPDAGQVYSMLPYVAILSLVVLVFSTFNAALGGFGRTDLTSYNEGIVGILTIIVSAILLSLKLGLWAMIFGNLVPYLAVFAISAAQVQRRMPIRLLARTRLDGHKLRQLLGTGGWILSSGAFASLLLPFTRVMLSRYAGLEAVAVNDMCISGSARVKNIFDAAFRPMMPELSSNQAQSKAQVSHRIQTIDRKALKIVLFVALPFFVMLIIAIDPLLHVWLRQSFNPLLPNAFRIALLGTFAGLLGSSSYYMLIGLGSARDSAYSAGIQFAVNALMLLAIAVSFGRLTHVQAVTAFAASTACSTIYLRVRLGLFAQSTRNEAGPLSEGCNSQVSSWQ